MQPKRNGMSDPKPSALNLIKCKCPRCRIGNMFEYGNPYSTTKFMKMKDSCEVCKQPYDLEVGFYYGSSYVSYALTVALSVATFVAWWVLIGFSLNDNRIFYWLTFNAILLLALQPWLMRFSRTLWLSFFVKYNKHWRTVPPQKTERMVEEHKHSW